MSDLQFLGHDLIFVSTKPAAAHDDEGLVATATGQLNGENDPDRTYVGNTINFSAEFRWQFIASKRSFSSPEVTVDGAVDYSDADEFADD